MNHFLTRGIPLLAGLAMVGSPAFAAELPATASALPATPSAQAAASVAQVAAVDAGISAGDLARLRARVNQAPDDPDAHFDLAMGLAHTSHLEEGWNELKKVNALDPHYVDTVIARYEPLVQQNGQNVEARFRLAFGYYFKALQDPSDAEGLKEKAGDQFRAILAVDPNYVWAYDYLGYLDAEKGDLTGAEHSWKKAIAVSPDNAAAHFLLGQAYYRGGDMAHAVTELATAMKLRSEDTLGIGTTAGGAGNTASP